MYDFLGVHVLKSDENAGSKKLRLLLCEFMLAAYVIPEIPSRHQVHNQIETFSVLKGLAHIYNKLVLDLVQQFSFVQD